MDVKHQTSVTKANETELIKTENITAIWNFKMLHCQVIEFLHWISVTKFDAEFGIYDGMSSKAA